MILLLVYVVVFEFYQFYLWPLKATLLYSISYYLFSTPFVMDIAVVTSSCFFLYNLYVRFEVLNDFWKCLPDGLVAVSDKWTNSEVAVLMESIRLLHAELCELMRIFSLCYGPVLFFLFLFGYINMIFDFLFLICMRSTPSDSYYTEDFLRDLIPHLINLQIVFFMVSIVMAVSLINEKVKKLNVYLVI